MTVVKFPYNACRAVHSRKPRRSKNRTPEERAAKAAAIAARQVLRRQSTFPTGASCQAARSGT
jgi:hypothetical protein